MTDGLPPDAAQGRVTDPERFRRLWAAADELVDRLDRDYDVDRDEGSDIDPDLIQQTAAGRIVRLRPRGDGAPLVIAYTDFPGLRVRFGHSHTRALPHCGCDACDEQADGLIDELARTVTDLVAGHFSESLTLSPEPWLGFRFKNQSGGGPISPDNAARLGDMTSVHWLAWSSRRVAGD